MFNTQSLQVFTSHAPFIRKVLKDQRESINQTKGLRGIQETEKKGHLQDDEVSSQGLLIYGCRGSSGQFGVGKKVLADMAPRR